MHWGVSLIEEIGRSATATGLSTIAGILGGLVLLYGASRWTCGVLSPVLRMRALRGAWEGMMGKMNTEVPTDLDAIIKDAVKNVDFAALQAFNQSLATETLPERDLYEYLRQEGFGKETLLERIRGAKRQGLISGRQQIEKSALGNSLEHAINRIVWQVERRWLFRMHPWEIPVYTGQIRIGEDGIQQVLIRLFGLNKEAADNLQVSLIESQDTSLKYWVCVEYWPPRTP
jgi:hypothetical protein